MDETQYPSNLTGRKRSRGPEGKPKHLNKVKKAKIKNKKNLFMTDNLLEEHHTHSDPDIHSVDDVEEGEVVEPFDSFLIPPTEGLEEEEVESVYSPPSPTYEGHMREREKPTTSSSDNTVSVYSAQRIAQLDSLDVKKIKTLRDDILAQCQNSTTPIKRSLYMSKEVADKIKARLRKAYPNTDIDSFSHEEYFDRIIRYELTKDSATIYTVDHSSDLINVDITMSVKCDWVEVLHDKLIDKMSAASGGKQLCELTKPQHNAVVDALCGKLKKISDYPGPYETAARLLLIEVMRTLQAYRRSYHAHRQRNLVQATNDFFVTVDRFIDILTEKWKPVMLAIKQLQRYNLIQSLDHDLEGEYERIVQKKAQSKEHSKKAKPLAETATAAPTTTKTGAPKPCCGCGKPHPGGWGACNFKNHPDFNSDKKLFFYRSDKGKLYSKLQMSSLNAKKKLSADGKSLVDHLTPEVIKEYIYALYPKLNPSNYFTVRGLAPKDKLEILLDSGALGGNNYITPQAVEILKKYQCVNTECNCPEIKICSAFDNCQNNKKCINLDIQLYHSVDANMITHITTTARVVEGLKMPIILGLATIRDYQLCRRYPAYFENKSLPQIAAEAFRAPGVLVDTSDQGLRQSQKEDEVQDTAPSRSTYTPSRVQLTPSRTDTSSTRLTGQLPTNKERAYRLQHTDYVNLILHKNELWDIEEDNDEDDFQDEDLLDIELTSLTSADPIDMIHIEGSEEKKSELRQILRQYEQCFKEEVNKEAARVPPFQLDVDKNKWENKFANKQAPRFQSNAKEEEIQNFIQNAKRLGLIEDSQAEAWSQVHLTKKPNGKWRFCIDYRNLNNATTGMGWPLPNIKKTLERIGSRKPKYFAVLDLTQGYYQTPISKSSRAATAFRTSTGLYQWTRLPMGLKGAPSYFQQQMQQSILTDLLYTCCEIYIDDIIIYGSTWEEFLNNLHRVLERLQQFNVTLNPNKAKIGVTSVEYVGHVISNEGLSMSEGKREKVQEFRQPLTQKDMKSFLGMTNQFRPHLKGYEQYGPLLHNMTKNYDKRKNKPLVWNDDTLHAFHKLKADIAQCTPLYFMHDTAPIFLHTDASQYGIGAYLFQVVDGQEQPIAILSKTLTGAQLNWSTIEKECFAIYYAFREWEYLLRDTKFTLRTDHKNLTFINLDHREKVKRWKILMSSYDFEVEHIPGKDNVVADGLSRFCAPNQMVEDTEQDVINLLIDEQVKGLPKIPHHAYEKIRHLHNELAGHKGVESTIQRLTDNGDNWTHMRRDVTNFIRRCPFCQKVSDRKNQVFTSPFTTGGYAPFHRVAIDSIGPLPVDEDGHKHILVVIDAFSRFCYLIPTADLSGQTAAKALIKFFGLFGVPGEIVSDNGTQFANQTVEHLLKALHSEHVRINAYSHEENGLVERANKEILRFLRAIVNERKIKRKWSEALPFVQRITNAQTHSVLGVSPAQIIFGNTIDLDRGIISPISPMDEMPYDDYVQQQSLLQAEILQAAADAQFKEDQYNIAARAPSQPHTEFPTNSYVLARYEGDDHRPPSKLETRWRGPLRVITCANSVCTVQHLVTNKLEDLHITLLKPFHYDAEQTDPHQVAAQDEGYYIIAEVLDHRFVKDGAVYEGTNSRGKLSHLQLLVHYEGDDEPLWQQWSTETKLNHATKVHDYLRANKLARFVPAQYKRHRDEV